MRRLFGALLCAAGAAAGPPTELAQRGYSVVPAPRVVRLEAGEVVFGGGWTVEAAGVPASHIAVRSLVRDMAEFHGVALARGAGARVVRLRAAAGTVATRAETGVDTQAYRLRIGERAIEIAGNADAGLFYGVQTLVQLLRRDAAGRLLLPRGVVEDWPKLELRFLHWDTKHHQDRMATLKRYLDWAARFKANMIGFELEDKFAYPSHPVIGAPGAFTTAELQEIVDYGLERFIQVVPVVQAPAHLAYVLKHPEFAALRADGNNYQSALCDPRTYDLIFSMYDDVMRATRGVRYLFVSTDEVYYAGIEGTCRAYTPENRSLAWVEFVRRARDHAAKQGRRILVWAEYPLLAQHVKMIPPDVIDGVIGEEAYLAAENALGMRQLAYVSMQGGEDLFPDNLAMDASRGRLQAAYEYLAEGRPWRGRPIGAFGAAWDDNGLHNETFWMGWSAVAQWAWNPGAASPAQHAADFVTVYYGPRARDMVEVYRVMQRQARAWNATWERVVSRMRGPGYGNSYGKGTGTERRDLTLAPPPLPALPDLKAPARADERYAKFYEEARTRLEENDRLVHTLHANLGQAERNRYNLEVFLAVAEFMGHHWRLLESMRAAEASLAAAQQAAGQDRARQAVGQLVAAHNTVARVRREGERTFAALTAVYEKSRFPKGQSVGGRKFVHVFDDTKDHFADRTPDLGFLMAPERGSGFERWLKDLAAVIETYARQHGVPVEGLAEARLEQ